MALLGKTDWYSAEKKIILTIALAILIASVSVFAILYLMMRDRKSTRLNSSHRT